MRTGVTIGALCAVGLLAACQVASAQIQPAYPFGPNSAYPDPAPAAASYWQAVQAQQAQATGRSTADSWGASQALFPPPPTQAAALGAWGGQAAARTLPPPALNSYPSAYPVATASPPSGPQLQEPAQQAPQPLAQPAPLAGEPVAGASAQPCPHCGWAHGWPGGPAAPYSPQAAAALWGLPAAGSCGPPLPPDAPLAGPRAAGAGGGWFFLLGGLLMTRDDENHYFFSYDTFSEERQRLDSREADMEWGGGFEARFGRYFACRRWAVEGAYWGLFPESEESVLRDYEVTGNLNGILNWNQLNYNGDTADQWVNNAVAHRVRRDFEFHNVEVNVIKTSPVDAAACAARRWEVNWLGGFRFFKFAESMEFGADTVDAVFNGAPPEIYYDIDVDNNLYGFQLGGVGRYWLSSCVALDGGASLGVFANHIDHRSRIGGSAGAAVINNGPNVGVAFDVTNDKNDVAMLGELRAGVLWRLSRCWTAGLGYRAVALTGVALPTNQIYPDLRGVQDVRLVDANGSLILHGAYGRLELNY